jgi:ligand-binding sensor domain-containing protein
MKLKLTMALSAFLAVGSFAQTFTNYTSADGLLSDNVNCLDTDASNNLWFGTQNGVSMFDGTTWTGYTTTDGVVDNTIQAIHVATNGDVWVGTDFGASVFASGVWTSYTTTDGLGNNQIKCISEDSDGDIWFGTNNGTSEFDGTNWSSLGTSEGLPFGGVVDIDQHSNGNMYFSTGLGGVYIYDGTAMTSITESEGLLNNRVRALVINDQNNKWVGTADGITVLDNSDAFFMNHTTMLTLPAPDTLNPIEDIEMDSQGNIWVGVYVDYLVTEGGVCGYNGSQWVEYQVADGLVGPVVRAVAIDDNDDLWVATSTGVSKLSNHGLSVEEQAMNEFVVYPNPASDVVTIVMKEGTADVVEIYNNAMQLVKSENMVNAKVAIDVTGLSSGMYFVKVNNTISKLNLN